MTTLPHILQLTVLWRPFKVSSRTLCANPLKYLSGPKSSSFTTVSYTFSGICLLYSLFSVQYHLLKCLKIFLTHSGEFSSSLTKNLTLLPVNILEFTGFSLQGNTIKPRYKLLRWCSSNWIQLMIPSLYSDKIVVIAGEGKAKSFLMAWTLKLSWLSTGHPVSQVTALGPEDQSQSWGLASCPLPCSSLWLFESWMYLRSALSQSRKSKQLPGASLSARTHTHSTVMGTFLKYIAFH